MTELPVRRLRWNGGDIDGLLRREWLVTNGLGGYASGTVLGVPTRRYHGLLVAALPNPLGRVVMLNHLIEQLVLDDGTVVQLGGEERPDRDLQVPTAHVLAEFRLEGGLPVWEYRIGPLHLERRIVMPHRQNTVCISYRLLGGGASALLQLRPAVNFRSYEDPVDRPLRDDYSLAVAGGEFVLSGGRDLPPLHLVLYGEHLGFSSDAHPIEELVYRVEEERGYRVRGALWTPGHFTMRLHLDNPVSLVASTESHDIATAVGPGEMPLFERERRRRLLTSAPPALRDDPIGAELVLAADQFVITPAGRLADAVRAWSVGDEIRTVIAGYHWFTDWGRDTMISLEGLTLATGRHREAGAILRAFALHVRDGLIPNMFPDGSDEGLYHTADATLWFFHAIGRYLDVTGNRALLDLLLPTLVDIVEHHRRGTRFGIGVDPADGLLRQGADSYQLTWMDAKVDEWVVTPRRGKAVEINALWYNALRLMEEWTCAEWPEYATELGRLAAQVRESFNRRFWFEDGGYLYDVVDGPEGDSVECRPNQLLAISLTHPVLDRSRWERVVEVVGERLLTPVGLRSLAPGSPAYQPRYYGDLRARDAAYHQGTVWGWLVGPWIDAWLRLHPEDRVGARRFLEGLVGHLDDFGVGSLAEIFDAEPPYTPRGCIAQAWTVAEVLRCWLATAPDPEAVHRS